MPVISAIIEAGAALWASISATTISAAVGRFALQMVATFAVSSLMSRRGNTGAGANSSINQGQRVQLPPSTDNKIPVVYGTAYMKPIIIDAKISTDQKTMWYVVAFCEAMDNDSIGQVNITNIYWGDRRCVFADTDKSKVTSWINADGTEDTSPNGLINIYGYRDGSLLPVAAQPSIPSAITVMSDAAIDSGKRWTSSNKMTKLVFAIVKMTYNNDKGIIGLPEITAQISNSVYTPGAAIKDYLTNSRYGAGLPSTMVDSTGLDALDTYSAQTISYTPHGGGSPTTMRRYSINGPIDTSRSFLENLTDMCESSDSWLQWNEQTGKWGVVINKGYASTSSIVQLNDSQIVGGITINPLDLNSNYNKVEVQFPNNNIRDQNSYYSVDLTEFSLTKFPNEPDNTLSLSLPLTNNVVQAQYVANRRILQSRDDLVISFQMNYSGIRIDAGDIIGVHHNIYAWGKNPDTGAWYDTTQTMPYGKLFRVSQVQEERSSDGVLYTRITASEYNNNVYVDNNMDLRDFQLSLNSGIADPNNMVTPSAPTITTNTASAAVPTFTVNATVPSTGGSVKAVEYWYGTSPNLEVGSIQLYGIDAPAGAVFFTAGGSSTMKVPGLAAGTYYWRVRTVGGRRKSEWSAATSFVWDPTFQSKVSGSGFQVTFQPGTIPIPRTYSGGSLTPTLGGIRPVAYGSAAGALVPYVAATSDSDALFTTNSWRIAVSSSTGIVNGSSVVQTGITFDPTAITVNAGSGAYFPAPTAVTQNLSQVELKIRYKDAAGVVVQSNPATIIFPYQDVGASGAPGASGAAGASGYTTSRPRIFFLAPLAKTSSDITITGGVYNRGTQKWQTLPTVTVSGVGSVTVSDNAMNITTGYYRWSAYANVDVGEAATGTFNASWTSVVPFIDGGFGPAGADGTSGQSIDFKISASSFVYDKSSNVSPTTIRVQVIGYNIPNTSLPTWTSITGDNNSARSYSTTVVYNDTVTITPNSSSPYVSLTDDWGGFSQTITLPIIKYGVDGAPGATGAAGATGASGTGSRGFIPLGYVPVNKDPATLTNAEKTSAFTTEFNSAPINGDAAAFWYAGSASLSAIYNGSSWVTANKQIPGDLIVSGSVRAISLAANDIYARKFASTDNTGASFGSNSATGFWLDSTNGNARFGGSVSIGSNLTVSGLITTGALNIDTVGTTNITSNSVTRVLNANGAVNFDFYENASTQVRLATGYATFPAGTTLNCFFTTIKVDGGSGDLELILEVYNDSNQLVDTFIGGGSGKRAVQSMSPYGDKVTATFSGSYTLTQAGTYKVTALMYNSYGGGTLWRSARAELIVIGAKR